MVRKIRQRNEKLLAVINDCRWTYEACAAAVRAVAWEHGDDLRSCDRSMVGYWVAGVRPRARTAEYLAEAVSRRLGRLVQPVDLGLLGGSVEAAADHRDWWMCDPVADLVLTGRADVERRALALNALYSLAALAVPLEVWREVADRGRRAVGGGAAVGRGEIDAVREMFVVLGRADERFGGGHARLAVVQYLTSDVAGYLQGRFATAADRAAMFTAAAQVAWLAGRKAFDSACTPGLAQRYYVQSFRLAVEAGDRPLAGFVLRALAHQAVDLGHGQQAVRLTESALGWSRGRTTPAAMGLIEMEAARGHAATGDRTRTTAAISAAESHLSQTSMDDEQPDWVSTLGFTEAGIAAKAGEAYRLLGDPVTAEAQLRKSITARNTVAYRRAQVLTLANLGDVQCAQGRLREACTHWNLALDSLSGVTSGRATAAVRSIRHRLRSFGSRLPAFAKRLDQRAAAYLRGDPVTP